MNQELNNENNNQIITKKAKLLMFITLFSAIIIFFDSFITSMDWYWKLQWQAVMNQDEKLKLALKTFKELIVVVNWTIVLINTIISIIYLFFDKKNQKNISIYKWYIIAGVGHIIIGTIGLTPFIYSIATLNIARENKKIKKVNKQKFKSENILIIISTLIIISMIFTFIAIQTGLFNKIEEKTNEIKENKQIIVEDNDDSHKITTFNKIINDWGNKVEENKLYKIQNVKLNNITASLYIDYKIKSENEKTITTITFKHGDNELYTYTDKHNYFNLSFLSLHDNVIIYGIKNCDSIDNGICNKHLTYSQILAFNKDDIITIYNNAIITEGTGFTIYRNNSIFLEDEYIYAEPYNDFRVYDIKINNNDIYFYTIVEDYDNIFTKDYNFRDNNCDDPYWNTIRFDMQRTFKTNFKFDEEYKKYELDELVKLSSIKYEDYCTNKNVLEFNK